ncbi:MAG TPA: transcription termination factor Rho [Thermodesulfobacteriota bacterium]
MTGKEIEKLPTPKLKEEALKIEGLTGVHGMNKEELIKVLKQHYGIKEEGKKPSASTRELKAKVRELKARREEARQSGDRKRVDILRRRVKRLKRRMRRTA